ncbi:MAG: AMP-binding protein, partial [Burkholderiaceae bacterium]
MNLAQLLARTAQGYPEAPAIFYGTRLMCNYRELAHRAASIAGYFSNTLKLVPGDRVALFMSNNPAYLEVLYGAWYAGLVVVAINPKLHPREASFILQDSGASVLFLSVDLTDGWSILQTPNLQATIISGSPAYDELLRTDPVAQIVQRAPNDMAWLFYSSGTTGRPKGIMQSHGNLWAMTMCYFTDVDAVKQQDAIVYAAPMSHGAGMYNFAHVLMG